MEFEENPPTQTPTPLPPWINTTSKLKDCVQFYVSYFNPRDLLDKQITE